MDDARGRYELLDRIGAGGMAEVYRARMVGAAGFEKPVAIKRILADFSKDHEFVSRFVDEARLTARLVHPNICQIVDFGVMEGRHFIAMEFVDGLDLSKLLWELDQEEERMPLDVALFVMISVLRGLKHAHEAVDEDGRPLGIVHRDVSPANVLLSVNGDVKLTDLGAATANPDQRSARTQKHFRLGKVLYMAPEQRSRSQVDIRADLYSAGVLLTEMLLGQSRFQRIANMYLAGMCTLPEQVLEAMGPETGRALASFVARATEKELARRFGSASEMLAALDNLFAELAPGTSVERVARLVARLQQRSAARKPLLDTAGSGPEELSISSEELISLAPEEDDDLDEAPTVGRSGSSNRVPVPSSDELEPEALDGDARSSPLATPEQRFPEVDASADESLPTTARYREPPQLVVGLELGEGRLPRAAEPEPPEGRSRALAIGFLGFALAGGLAVGALLARDRLASPPIQHRPRPRAAAVAAGPTQSDPVAVATRAGASASASPEAGLSPPGGRRLSIAEMALAGDDDDGGLGDAGRRDGGSSLDEGSPPPSPEKQQPRSVRHRHRDERDRRDRSPREAIAKTGGVGFLNINSRPFGVPYVDGVKVGAETPVARLKLAAGTHRVKVFFPQASKSRTRTVRVRADETQGVVVVLDD